MKSKVFILIAILFIVLTLGIVLIVKSSFSWPRNVLKGHWRESSTRDAVDVYFSGSGLWNVEGGKTKFLRYEISDIDKGNLKFEMNVFLPRGSRPDEVVSSAVKMSQDGKEIIMTTHSRSPFGVLTMNVTYKKVDQETEPPSAAEVGESKPDFARIHALAMGGRLSEIKELIEKGADINLQDSYGFTALHFACRDGHPEVVRYLLEHKADPNALSHTKISPLNFAIRAGERYPEIVTLLIQYGANVNVRNDHGSTPLHEAAYDDKVSGITKILLDSGADPKILNREGKSPLDVANEQAQKETIIILKKAMQVE